VVVGLLGNKIGMTQMVRQYSSYNFKVGPCVITSKDSKRMDMIQFKLIVMFQVH
jgi:ribosomal protein L3